ncbi:uncharacterized protein BCR38DRAFT_341961, partial [Pseudomassariella vexata]
SESGLHICLASGCDSKPFKRKADLQRHYRHRHCQDSHKKAYYCDYPKCQRRSEPFHRLDHCRDHYREFHSEDLVRKNGKEGSDWFANRYFSRRWWRCTKCLQRNMTSDGWTCGTPGCQSHCDTRRRELRGYK